MSPYNAIKHRNLFMMRKLDTLLEDVKASQPAIEEGASALLWRTFFSTQRQPSLLLLFPLLHLLHFFLVLSWHSTFSPPCVSLPIGRQ